MDLGLSNVASHHYQNYRSAGKKSENTVRETGFEASVNQRREAPKESVVDSYKRKHPEDAAHVNTQVNAGKKVLAKNGADRISRDEMSMSEYQNFIKKLLDNIPFDSTRLNDREIISISDKGWEQMKKDSDYEAWVLGYTVENRSVRNPFAGWPGASASLYVENFGASIEEHVGKGMPLNGPESKRAQKEDSEESWWEKRQKRMKKLMKEQEEEAQNRRIRKREQAMQEYQQQYFESRQRMTEYLNGRAMDTGAPTGTKVSSQIMAYEKNIIEITGGD